MASDDWCVWEGSSMPTPGWMVGIARMVGGSDIRKGEEDGPSRQREPS